MPTKITIIYDNPIDAELFERRFAETDQITLARTLPGLRRLESSKVWPKEDGSATPAYRIIDLYFPDYDTASAAVEGEAAAALFPTISEIATGGVRIVFADVEVDR